MSNPSQNLSEIVKSPSEWAAHLALCGLDKVELEQLEKDLRSLEGNYATARLGQVLIGLGRHEEAITLLDNVDCILCYAQSALAKLVRQTTKTYFEIIDMRIFMIEYNILYMEACIKMELARAESCCQIGDSRAVALYHRVAMGAHLLGMHSTRDRAESRLLEIAKKDPRVKAAELEAAAEALDTKNHQVLANASWDDACYIYANLEDLDGLQRVVAKNGYCPPISLWPIVLLVSRKEKLTEEQTYWLGKNIHFPWAAYAQVREFLREAQTLFVEFRSRIKYRKLLNAAAQLEISHMPGSQTAYFATRAAQGMAWLALGDMAKVGEVLRNLKKSLDPELIYFEVCEGHVLALEMGMQTQWDKAQLQKITKYLHSSELVSDLVALMASKLFWEAAHFDAAAGSDYLLNRLTQSLLLISQPEATYQGRKLSGYSLITVRCMQHWLEGALIDDQLNNALRHHRKHLAENKGISAILILEFPNLFEMSEKSLFSHNEKNIVGSRFTV